MIVDLPDIFNTMVSLQDEIIKGFIAQKDCSNAYKESLIEAYDLYCRVHSIEGVALKIGVALMKLKGNKVKTAK